VSDTNTPVVELANVSKIYPMGEVTVTALRDINLRIEPRDFIAIVGPSGSGKTTMLNVLGCLDLPSAGTQYLQGHDVASLNDAQLSRLRSRGIGFIFQNYSLLPSFSALRNVELPHYYASGRGNRKRALALLEQVGLADRVNHKPSELSGGQQQRVAVARALINDPFLILADEPTGNLDTASGDALLELFKELNEKQGLTIVIVTHNPAVSTAAHRVIHMRDGLIVSDETR
jgi:putative ABC transport system ATP-binding protein